MPGLVTPQNRFDLDVLKAALVDALYAQAPLPLTMGCPPGAIRLTGAGGTQSGELTAQLLRQVGGKGCAVASGTLQSKAESGLWTPPRGSLALGGEGCEG